jgi:hypothetical protein
MEFTEHNVPKSIFRNLSFEDFLFSFSESYVVSIAFDDLMTVPFSDPVSEIVSEHGSDTGESDRTDEMSFSPKPSYQYHDIHPWYGCPDDRERLDTG